jgi:hypothetical protein
MFRQTAGKITFDTERFFQECGQGKRLVLERRSVIGHEFGYSRGRDGSKLTGLTEDFCRDR